MEKLYNDSEKKENNASKYESLVKLHYQMLHRYVNCRVSDRFDSENIVQETLILAWLNFNCLRNHNAFKGWLISIASNCCKKYYANKGKSSIPIEDESLAHIINKDRLDEVKHGNNLLMESIDILPLKQKQAIKDFYFNNLKIKEISFIRKVPEGTIKRRLHDARKNIKERLDINMDNKFKNIIPVNRPEITISPKKTESYDVTINEVPWMYCDLRIGHKIIWGIYDAPLWNLTDCAVTETKRSAIIHGIDCVEIEIQDYNSPSDAQPQKVSNLYVHADESQIQYVAASHIENGIYKMTSLFDEDFIKSYSIEFPRKIQDFGFSVYEDGDQTKITFASDDDSLLIGAGVFDVTIGGKTYECLRIIDRWNKSPRILVENYISRDGRSILFRRYNHPVWKLERYKSRWDEKLPESEKLSVNGETYIHWYDCLSDIVFR